MKKILVTLVSMSLFALALAGGIDNKQNFGTKYIGSTSRNAAVDGADIAAYNPAGVMMGQDGLKLSVDGQYILKTYEHAYTNALENKDITSKSLCNIQKRYLGSFW